MPRKKMRSSRRRICFVTGSRAEFGLMRSALEAIAGHEKLQLQIVATGMHLDARRGKTVDAIRGDKWRIDAVVPWGSTHRAAATGEAMAHLAEAFRKLQSDIVLVVGDRVEAFAAAAAAHLCDIPLAHVHGGDRAMGQMDDSLRHAISKLAHLHFPATRESADRLARMGEDRWRIHRVGSPGIDGIEKIATDFAGVKKYHFALVLLHPVSNDQSLELRRATMILDAIRKANVPQTVIIYPNNDPGAAGIIRCWESLQNHPDFIIQPNVARPEFLGLLRDAAMLVGNSSSGIIEAASFRTLVVDIGPRQLGRERSGDVRSVPYRASAIAAAIREIWNNGNPRRATGSNPYQGTNTGRNIANILAQTVIDVRLLRKIIAY